MQVDENTKLALASPELDNKVPLSYYNMDKESQISVPMDRSFDKRKRK